MRHQAGYVPFARYVVQMRLPFAIAFAGLLASCTTTFAEPRLLVTPYLAVYRLHGDVGMQSSPTPGTLQDNAAQSLRTFGQNKFSEDFGLRADLGDGFAGLRVDYYRLDQSTPRSGVLGADWGRLATGDQVQMNATMDEVRAGWLEPVWSHRTMYRDKPLQLRFAAGGVLTHRDMTMRATTTDGVRSQRLGISGNTAAIAARMRVTWRDVNFDLDYALSPNLVISGDYGKVQQDVEARLGYTLPLHDVTFFGGYRYSRIRANGGNDGFGYDADLVLDGWQFGITVTF